MTPGKDIIRKRYQKLPAVAPEFKAGDALRIANSKLAVEAEDVVTRKKVYCEKWSRIALLVDAGSDWYNPGFLEKKWLSMVEKSEVDKAEKYVGNKFEANIAIANSGSRDGSPTKAPEEK